MLLPLWNNYKGIVFTIISSFLLATTGIIIKIVRPEFPILQLAAYRVSGQVLFILPYVIFYQPHFFPFYNKKLFLQLLGRGFSGSTAMVFYYTALKYLNIGDASSIFYAHTTLVSVFACCFLGEVLDVVDLLLLVISLSGCVCVSQPKTLLDLVNGKPTNADDKVFLTGVGSALVALVLAATAFTFIKAIGKKVHFTVINFWYSIAGTLMLNIYVFIFSGGPYIFPDYRDLTALTFIIFSGFGAQGFRTLALQNESAFIVSVTGSTQIFFAFLFDYCIFSKTPNKWTIFGVLLIIGSVVTGVFKKKRNSKSASK